MRKSGIASQSVVSAWTECEIWTIDASPGGQPGCTFGHSKRREAGDLRMRHHVARDETGDGSVAQVGVPTGCRPDGPVAGDDGISTRRPRLLRL